MLFVGAGDLAGRCAAALAGPLARGPLVGLRRHPARLPPGLRGVAADYAAPGVAAALAAQAPALVVATLKPLGRDRDGYRRGFAEAAGHLARGLGEKPPRALLFVSSSRVYAERDGGWVDEAGALVSAAVDPAGAEIVAAEACLRDAGLPLTVLRCAGIYGGADGRLQRRVAAGELSTAEPVRYSNRIHRDDVGGFLAHLLMRAAAGAALAPVYNVVDDRPAPQAEVEAWLAEQLDVPEAERRYGARPPAPAHKRLRNALLHASGYRLRYPDYRAGYGAALSGQRPSLSG